MGSHITYEGMVEAEQNLHDEKIANNTKLTLLPLYACGVSAGAPLPASAVVEEYLDLNKKLIKNYAATFLVRANGDSMLGAGIHDQDILVVDRSLEAKNSDIIIASYNGDLLVKRLIHYQGKTFLQPENVGFHIIEVTDFTDFYIWGVVTSVIHSLKSHSI